MTSPFRLNLPHRAAGKFDPGNADFEVAFVFEEIQVAITFDAGVMNGMLAGRLGVFESAPFNEVYRDR